MDTKPAISIACALGLSLLIAASAAAQVKYVKMPPRNREAKVKLDSSSSKPSKIVFYIASPGNDTQRFDLSLYANVPVNAAVSYRMAKGGAGATAAQLKGWIPLKIYYDYKLRKTIKIGAQSADSTPAPTKTPVPKTRLDPDCGCLTEEIIKLLMKYQPGITRKEFCRMASEERPEEFQTCHDDYPEETTGDSDTGAGISDEKNGYGIIEKNACSRNSYVLKIEVPTDRIKPSDLARGVEFSAKTKFTTHKPGKKLILKRSDGGLFPNAPIALLPYIDIYPGADRVEVITWKGNKISRRVRLTRGDLMPLLGYHRLLFGSLFNGQKATFQVVSPFPGSGTLFRASQTAGYGRCFRLVDKRQEAN